MKTNTGQVSRQAESKANNKTIPNTLLFLLHSMNNNIELLYVIVRIWYQVLLRMSLQIQLPSLWNIEVVYHTIFGNHCFHTFQPITHVLEL
jgi:hypothetical protein